MAAFLASQQPQGGGVPQMSNLNDINVGPPTQNNTNAIIQNFQRLQGQHSAAIDQQRGYQSQGQVSNNVGGMGMGINSGINPGINPQAMNIHSQRQGLNLMPTQGMQNGLISGQGVPIGVAGGINQSEEQRRNMLEQM